MGGKKDSPFGKTLLARDTEANRKLFPDGPFGYEAVAESVCEGDRCPFYNYKEDADDGDGALATPIHILIAAFRDRLCGRTLHNAFTKAENPKRLFIRVIDQTALDSDKVDDAGCWELYCQEYNPTCDEYKNQVQIVRVDASQSLGPTWARAKLSAMIHWDHVHGEDEKELELSPVHPDDFCMQIDSHMDFSDNFDQGLVNMFHRTQNDYAVLSTYVADIEQNNKDPKTVPNLCMVTFTSSIRNWGTKECVKLVKPKLTNAMWGAGLSFHRCHAELSVPIDPYLDNVFDGEEGSRGIRLFTHGYDVYTPDKVLVTHDYHTHQGNPVVHTWGRGNNHLRHGAGEDEETLPTSWKWMGDIEKARDSWKTFGSRRVNMLLGIGSNFDSTEAQRTEVERIRQSRFGLGNKRSLEQVQEFTGINLLEEKMEKNGCGNLIWVPYEESPEYGLPQVLARGYDGSAVEATQEKNPAAVNPKKEANKQQVDPEDVDDQEKNPVAVDPEKEAKEQEGDIGHEKNPLVVDPEKEAEVQHREKEDAIDIESDLNDMDVPPPKTVLDPAEEAKKITKDPPVFKEPAKMDAIKKLSPPKTVLDSAEEAKNITKDPPVFKESAKMDAIKKLSPPVKPLDVAIPQSMKRAPSNVEVPQLRRVASSPQEGNDYYDYRKAGALMLLAFIFFKLVNHKKSKDDRKKN